MRVLGLHGYHGSGSLLRRQLAPLAGAAERGAAEQGGIEWVCVDAPSLARGDFGWWHLNFRGWEQTLDWMTDYLARHGPFDGVLGFSQGAALTSLLVGRRAPDGRVTPERPLSFGFAVMIGGFRSDSPAHAGLYAAADSYRLPSLHIMGKSDPVVPMADSMVMARQFAAPTVLTHPGGHVIPDTPEVLAGVRSFFADQAGHVGSAGVPSP